MSGRKNPGKARAKSIIYCLLAAFLFLGFELVWLQLVRGETLAARARDQRMEILSKTPVRGTIYDRNMQVLAGTFYEPVTVALHGVELHEDAVAKETADSAIALIRQPVRYDPQGLAAHAIGYLDSEGITGVSGIEKALDNFLRSGNVGLVTSFVDARRMPYEGLGIRWILDAAPQADVVLTIDRRIQEIVEKVMDEEIPKGAVVVMDPETGEILALASRPSFSPNNIGEAVIRPHAPMINRAITSYPAGSIMKIAVAACALENKLVSLADRFYDPGFINVGSTTFRCYLHENNGHGRISFLDAMAYSCNPVFIETAQRIGKDALVRLCENLGFGATTGVSLPFEHPGQLPASYTMSPQDLANLAIGQGDVMVTPVQVGVPLSTIANGGEVVSPKLVLDIKSRNGKEITALKPEKPERVLSEDTCRQLTFMLEAVTRWGTGKAAWLDGPGSCGKTGTAETGRLDSDGNPICHAWFAGFTPLNDPRFVIVVFSEEAGSGGEVAAPVFKKIAAGLLLQ